MLALTPYVGIIVAPILGFKGREWAWKNKNWASLDEFNRVQRQWSKWGLIIFLGVFVTGIVAAIAIPAYQSYEQRVQTAQSASPP